MSLDERFVCTLTELEREIWRAGRGRDRGTFISETSSLSTGEKAGSPIRFFSSSCSCCRIYLFFLLLPAKEERQVDVQLVVASLGKASERPTPVFGLRDFYAKTRRIRTGHEKVDVPWLNIFEFSSFLTRSSTVSSERVIFFFLFFERRNNDDDCRWRSQGKGQGHRKSFYSILRRKIPFYLA